MNTPAEALALALRSHQSGDLAGAERVYQQILSTEPSHAEAWHNLGVIAYQRGVHEIAVEYMRKSVAVAPSNEMYHCNLGLAYHALGQFDEAVTSYLEALKIVPEFVEALNNLGNALTEQGNLRQAIGCFERALQLNPGYALALNNLGNVYARLGSLDEAMAYGKRALEIQPNYVPAHISLGSTLQRMGKIDEAEAHCQEAIRLSPENADAHNCLGAALVLRGLRDEAARHFEMALQFNARHVDARCNLASILHGTGRLDEAEEHLRGALSIYPTFAGALMTLGLVQQLQGKLPEAIATYREAVCLDPKDADSHSNLLMCLNYDPNIGSDALLAEHRVWGERSGQAADAGPSRNHDRSPARRLRVGYVSPNLSWHSVAYFLEPILANHDQEQFEAVCYSQVTAPDAMTDKLMSLAQFWRNTFGLSDSQLAEMIRDDRIDILIDLAGHTANSRLAVFGHKPAPVQATYIGYPCTTGLSAVDYYITDSVADPIEEQAYFAEQLYRLPAGFCCYAAPALAPDVVPAPIAKNGFVTFGSLHPLAKLNDDVLDLWSMVLSAAPKSRLLIFRNTLQGSVRDSLKERLRQKGIDCGRVELCHEVDEKHQHFGAYHKIDISLDALPWSGHTTTCESLWMGVPMVTLRGSRHAGRMAASVLTQVGRPEWIADSREQYVEIARRLASDSNQLQSVRQGLREVMKNSPLCDGKVFTRRLEASYREMWQKWCGLKQ